MFIVILKVVFTSSLFKGLVILIVGIYALVIIDKYIKEKEYLQYKQAWQLLYSRQKEDDKQFLDKVWSDSKTQKAYPYNLNLRKHNLKQMK